MSIYDERKRERGLSVASTFNAKFPVRTTCFFELICGGEWRPTRTAGEAYYDEKINEVRVPIDGYIHPVLLRRLAMPDSAIYEQFIQDADEALEAHNTDRFAADCSCDAGEQPDDALFDQVIYHYAASVNLPQGIIHFDGILTVPPIKSMDDYQQYRAMIAADAKAQPEQVQVHSFCIVGAK